MLLSRAHRTPLRRASSATTTTLTINTRATAPPAASGLEWPHVFLVRMNEGDCPIAGAEGAALEEERRLAFVAFTRAKVRVAAVSARQCVPVRGW